jgi:hypothetical protein
MDAKEGNGEGEAKSDDVKNAKLQTTRGKIAGSTFSDKNVLGGTDVQMNP